LLETGRIYMTAKINLQDLIEEMDMQFDDSVTLVNVRTGELVVILNEFLQAAEDGNEPEDYQHEWKQEELEKAMQILENEYDFIGIPSKFDIHEYQMMEDFCDVIDVKKGNQLLNAIRGKGAFRRFKDKVIDLGIEDDWFVFREQAFRKIATEFCEQHDLDYE
jgi:hypothetical protein